MKVFALLLTMEAGLAFAQSSILDELNPIDSNSMGIQLYDVSLAGSYFTGSATSGIVSGIPLLNPTNSSLADLQVSTSLGWRRAHKDTAFSVVYSPSYVKAIYASKFHSFDQQFNVAASTKFGNKWTLASSLQGMMMDFSQVLLSPSLIGSGELTSTNGSGTTSGEIPVSGGVVGSPETSFAYGSRELTAAGSVSLVYAYSTRSTFHLSFAGNRTQFLSAGANGYSSGIQSLIPKTTTVGGDLGWSYALTPRTDLTFELTSARTVSRFQDAYTPQVLIGLARKLTPHWVVSGSVGGGEVIPNRSTYLTGRTVRDVYNGTLGYKLDSHTFSGAYSRSVSDVYGLGADATESGTGSWAWRKAGGTFSVRAAVGYAHLVGGVFHSGGSWNAQTNISKLVARHFFTSFSYNYVRFPQNLILHSTPLSENGAVVAVSWSPVVRP